MADIDTQAECEKVMQLVGRVAGLKLFQVLQFIASKQDEEIEQLRAALRSTRMTLLKCGYCSAGEHGTGDPEINAIDAALGVKTVDEQGPRDLK